MKCRSVLIFIVLTFSLSSELIAQESANNDAPIIYKTVSNFFDWYIDAIKQHKGSAFKPTFVESQSGMTTLDFSEYFTNLIRNGFSDSLIIKEKMSYKRCITNLENVKYIDLKTKFDALDDLERADCDFGNYYRWMGGQEPVDGVRIKSLQFNNPDSATAIVDYFYYNSKDYWGENVIKLIRIKGDWKIDDISIWRWFMYQRDK